MNAINQIDEPIVEEAMFDCCSKLATLEEIDEAIGLILDRLDLRIVRTNATRNGTVELVIRPL